MKKVIAIIGSGMMGSALAFPAAENGHEVRLVGTHLDRDIIDECRRSNKHPKFDRAFPVGVKYYQIEEYREAVAGADFVIGGVSSFGVDWFLNEILVNLDPRLPVLSVTKGLINLEDGTLISYPDYWRSELKKRGVDREVCAVGGPCTSYELVFHDQTEVAFCGRDTASLRLFKETLSTSYYHISLTHDVIGLESAVALKNAYNHQRRDSYRCKCQGTGRSGRIAIGNRLMCSPGFPPLHTVHAAFTAHGAPSS